jgi:hypothetical protein
MKGLSQFRKTRCRIQRLSDAKMLTGWAVDLTPVQLVVAVKTPDILQPGDVAVLEFFGKKNNLIAKGTFTMSLSGSFVFELSAPPKISAASEAPRMSVNNYVCTFLWDGLRGEGSIVDVSLTGVGMISSSSLEKGSVLDLTIKTPNGEILCGGTVKYCRPIPDSFEYRLGIELSFKDRLILARWQRLFTHLEAA